METLWVWVLVQAVLLGVIYLIVQRSRYSNHVQQEPKRARPGREESREMRELQRMRARSLSIPLTEKARPGHMEEIIGQEDGIQALRAALCGPNPQHVLIYGPPGCGKTCAARLVLDEAKKCPDSPFNADSRFVEIDATCVRFDERSIADPLMGSVHDPIYQGAGPMGAQGIPQPKPGAVSRAHCGVLFLDEIGELHPVQMNKLLKVLEDRKVYFESAYYSGDNPNIPRYIHEVFQNGIPADFRLVGATTRRPEELPPALRSRCVELYFKPLSDQNLARIARDAAQRLGYSIKNSTAMLLAAYCDSGRDAVNLIQLAGGAAYGENRQEITEQDIRWVTRISHCQRHSALPIPQTSKPGSAIALGVGGGGVGVAVEIECALAFRGNQGGSLEIGGAVEYEEMEFQGRKLGRKGMARASAENVLEAFRKRFGWDGAQYDVRFNIPGGMPMDGPSAGIALAVALMGAISGKAPIPGLALTGEITMQGEVRPVGGVREKLEAAVEAGAKTILIPEENWDARFEEAQAEIIPVRDIAQVMRYGFDIPRELPVEDGVLPFLPTTA